MYTNKRIIALSFAAAVALTACEFSAPTVKEQQEARAQQAANSIKFSANAEIENIKRRLELTSDPGLVGFVVLLNEMGQPVMYTGVKGKITSGGKRLTRTDESCPYAECGIRSAPSDEGTFGDSNPYVFFWTTEGQYIQWSGNYLYSDKPFRLADEPLVVAMTN